jgi:hypothetical protein
VTAIKLYSHAETIKLVELNELSDNVIRRKKKIFKIMIVPYISHFGNHI